MYCNKCGKELADGTVFCSSCGTNQNMAIQKESQPTRTNTMCIIGLVISGISLLINFMGLVGIAGTIVSVLGLQSCKQKGEKGKGLAIAGICIGACSILYGAIMLIVVSGLF